jgi:hypothetical protein
MHTRKEFVRWVSVLTMLALGPLACNLPTNGGSSGVSPTATKIAGPMISTASSPVPATPTQAQAYGTVSPPSILSLPTLRPRQIVSFLMTSTASAPSSHRAVLFRLGPTAGPGPLPIVGTPTPSPSDISDISIFWTGSPPISNGILYTTDCTKPVEVDSFSVSITAVRPTPFWIVWEADIFTYNSAGQFQSMTVASLGSSMDLNFDSAGTQTVAQGTPFTLKCGINYMIIIGGSAGNYWGGYFGWYPLLIEQQPPAAPGGFQLEPTATPRPIPHPTLIRAPIIPIPPIFFGKPTPTPAPPQPK